MKTLLALACLLFETGCVTDLRWHLRDFQHPDPSEKSIILDKSQTRDCWVSNTATLPQGVYKPELAIEKGIFYRAPIPILIKALGFNGPQYGGIYIPNEKDENQQHGIYILPRTGPQVGIMRLRAEQFKIQICRLMPPADTSSHGDAGQIDLTYLRFRASNKYGCHRANNSERYGASGFQHSGVSSRRCSYCLEAFTIVAQRGSQK